MGVEKMVGTPWHVERMHRQEGDDRRHKSRCEYYCLGNNNCEKRHGKCIGSAHCEEYKELSNIEIKQRQLRNKNLNKKKTGEDDCYWY